MTSLYSTSVHGLSSFARLDNACKTEMLNQFGILLDSYNERTNTVNIWFFRGFFVEQYLEAGTASISDIIPFRNGYRLRHFSLKPFSAKEAITEIERGQLN